ncbi:MAG: hypothetical protein Q4A78_07210 [Peptostreptococcaceae bacterium]|nr:hypothetical protein [Peptostreptococcaceae bacterium]
MKSVADDVRDFRMVILIIFVISFFPAIATFFRIVFLKAVAKILELLVAEGFISLFPLFSKDRRQEAEDAMRRKGIIGISPALTEWEIGFAAFALSTTGRILDAAIAGRITGKLRPMEEYVGLTMEEARQLVKRERERSIFRSEQKKEREKVILAALDDAEENLRKFHGKSEELRNKSLTNGNTQIEEPEDSLWEEE